MTHLVNAPELSLLMRGFEVVAGPRAPLYQRLAVGLADQGEVLALLAEAPLPNRMPVTLFAAVHDLLLADPSVPLAAYYPNLTREPRTDDPVPAFVSFFTASVRRGRPTRTVPPGFTSSACPS